MARAGVLQRVADHVGEFAEVLPAHMRGGATFHELHKLARLASRGDDDDRERPAGLAQMFQQFEQRVVRLPGAGEDRPGGIHFQLGQDIGGTLDLQRADLQIRTVQFVEHGDRVAWFGFKDEDVDYGLHSCSCSALFERKPVVVRTKTQPDSVNNPWCGPQPPGCARRSRRRVFRLASPGGGRYKAVYQMADAPITKRLHRRIILYSTAGLFVVGLAVGLVGVLPLTQKLREAQRRNLLVDLQRQTVQIDRFVNRARTSANSFGNRSRVRDSFTAYHRGEWSREQLAEGVANALREPFSVSTNVAGALLFDLQSNVVFRTGLPIPTNQWAWPDLTGREPALSYPFRIRDETYLVAGANIVSPPAERMGVAMTLVRARGLQQIIEDYGGLGRSGETIVGARENRSLPIFFPLRHARDGQAPPASRITTVMEGLQRGEHSQPEVYEPEAPLDETLVMAHGAATLAPWSIVVAMGKAELFAGVNRTLLVLGTVILLLISACSLGMVVVLRPLAGRVILHTDELESQIYEKTAALNTELAERKRAETVARDSEALYHSLVDTLPINILRKDLRGRVTYGNRGYCERMGRPLAELLGRTDYDLFPKELANKYLSDDEKVIRTGEMFEDIEEHRGSDGRKAFVHVLKAPVRDAQGRVVGTQVIFWDVTARKLAEEALEKTATDLARSNKELEQFAYVASHDLQEPLRMITSYTQLIGRRYNEKLDEDAKEFMRFAVEGALRMQKLIQGLLEYSRVGTKGRPFDQVDCNPVLDGALANLAISIEESAAQITRDTLPVVMGDSVQLTQLLQNLVGNAIKFHGPQPPRIHLSAKRQARPPAAASGGVPFEWIFSVRDNGIGIEPQYFERIFVIFQRLHTQDQYPGTGIGLAVCKKIVERHGGRIWLESKPGAGTTFFFAFPALD